MLKKYEAPFYDDIARAPKGGLTAFRTTKDGVSVRVGLWKTRKKVVKGTVLVFQGRTEFLEKFGPAYKEFNDMGYHAAAVDWRGQGLSDRLHSNPRLGHIDSFESYQRDVDALMEFLEEQGITDNFYLLAHSMGGAIGMTALSNGLKVEKAVFSAPMWGIAVEGWKRKALKLYVDISGGFLFGLAKIPTMPHRNASITEPFEGNNLTNDPEEYAFRKKQLVDHPDLELAGPTISWVVAAFNAASKIRKIRNIKTTMICVLGENESIVDKKIIKKMPNVWDTLKLTVYPEAQHELLIELPEVQKAIWTEIRDFFKA